jgi:hypothetical protein
VTAGEVHGRELINDAFGFLAGRGDAEDGFL